MPLFIQKIPHLLFGVSQRPEVQRDPSHLTSCDNWLARATYGLAKRPPFAFLGKLTSTITGIAGATIFSIQRDNNNRYRVVIQDGTLKVYDMINGGAAVTVEDRTGAGTYLDDAGGAGFRHVTVGDATFIANRGVEVSQGSGKSASQNPYALITVEQADFSTNYTITLNGTVYDITTVDQGDATSRGQLNTDQIAQELFDEMSSGVQNIWTTILYDTQLLGSTIFIQSRFNIDFPVNVSDGLSDNGLRLVKGEIVDAEDLLFTRAPNGLKVHVTGDPGNDKDDFWLVYDSTGSDPSAANAVGIWKETIAPGTATTLDNTTLPHRLAFNASKIEGQQQIEVLPAAPAVGDNFDGTETGGWTEEIDGTAWPEITDSTITVHGEGRRRLIPGADGSTRQTARIVFDIDTANVRYGMDVIVSWIHRTAAGSETNLVRKVYAPGSTILKQKLYAISEAAGEPAWVATDRFVIKLEYGDDAAQLANETATMNLLGARTGVKTGLFTRYTPITTWQMGGVTVTLADTTYREGTQISVDLNFNSVADTFLYVIPAGGETGEEVATGLAAVIDTTGTTDYTASASGLAITASVTGSSSADPAFAGSAITYVDDKAVVPLTLTVNEFIGETLKNITDGSEGSITANTTDGVFDVILAGGTDNLFTPGDRIEVVGTGGYFVWEPVTYDSRLVGDEDTNPWPSFKDKTVTDIFFYRNRLGIVSGRGVVLSESGDVLNFFRNSIQALLDGDVIDVESAHGDVAIFHAATPWNNTLFLWSENAQYELSGIPVLSPKTVRLDVVSRYPNTSNTPPAVIGPRLYFAHSQTGSGKIMEWQPPVDDVTQYLARDITVDVPTYIPGNVIDIAGDYSHGVVGVLADGDPDAVFIWSFTPGADGNNIHEAWQRWLLPTGSTGRQLDFADGKIALVYSASDGVFVDEADVDQSIGDPGSFLDRRITEPTVLDTLADFDTAATVVYRSDEAGDDVTEGRVNTWPSSAGASADFTLVGDGSGSSDGPALVVAGTPEGTDYADWFQDVFFSERLMYNDTGSDIDLSTEFSVFTVVRLSSVSTSPFYGLGWMSAQTPDAVGTADCTFRWGLMFTGGKWKVYFDRKDSETAVSSINTFFHNTALESMPLDTWVVLGMKVSTSGSNDRFELWYNGVQGPTTTTTPRLASTGGYLGLGGHKWDIASGTMEMDQACFYVFDSALSDSQMTLVSDLLTEKHIDDTQVVTSEVEWPYEENGEGVTETVDSVLYGGVPFTARARLSPIYFRGQDGKAETGGRTQIRELQVEYNNTEDLKVEVTPAGRALYTHTVANALPIEGSKRVPVLSRAETVQIELVSDDTGDARVNSIDIEMQVTNRSRRA